MQEAWNSSLPRRQHFGFTVSTSSCSTFRNSWGIAIAVWPGEKQGVGLQQADHGHQMQHGQHLVPGIWNGRLLRLKKRELNLHSWFGVTKQQQVHEIQGWTYIPQHYPLGYSRWTALCASRRYLHILQTGWIRIQNNKTVNQDKSNQTTTLSQLLLTFFY